MRKVWVIAAREYKAAVKTKSFLIGIILLPVLMGGGIVAQALFKDQADLRPKRFAIVDRTSGGHFFPLLAAAAKQHNDRQAAADSPTQAAFLLESVPPPAPVELAELRLALSDRVRRGDLAGFLEIGPEILKPVPVPQAAPQAQADVKPDELAALSRDLSAALGPHALRYQSNRPFYRDCLKWAEALITAAVRARRAEQQGVALADFNAIAQPVPALSKSLATRDPRTGAIDEGVDQNPIVAMLVPGGLVILMLLMVLLGATPLLQGVMEEKMQRIAEVLLGSVQPFPLMMGKIVGMAAVSVTMASIYLLAVYWAVRAYGYEEYLSTEIIFWFLLYQVLALFLYGSVYAAIGAACTDLKEAQAMLMPVTLVIMVPMFVWVNVIREPTSTFATTMSLFPLATPMLMIGRMAVPPGIPLWQPVLGVLLVLATALLCVYAAGRVFRVGLLLQGKGAGLRDLWHWVLRG